VSDLSNERCQLNKEFKTLRCVHTDIYSILVDSLNFRPLRRTTTVKVESK
jgi:hypothetical protein